MSQPKASSLDGAIAGLLHHFTISSTPPNLVNVEEDVVNISEMLRLSISQKSDSQKSGNVEHLVRKLLHIIRGGIPAVSQQSVPDTPERELSQAADSFRAEGHTGPQVLQHARSPPMMVGPLCAEGQMAACVLQTLSRHHAIVFQVIRHTIIINLIAVVRIDL